MEARRKTYSTDIFDDLLECTDEEDDHERRNGQDGVDDGRLWDKGDTRGKQEEKVGGTTKLLPQEPAIDVFVRAHQRRRRIGKFLFLFLFFYFGRNE